LANNNSKTQTKAQKPNSLLKKYQCNSYISPIDFSEKELYHSKTNNIPELYIIMMKQSHKEPVLLHLTPSIYLSALIEIVFGNSTT